MKNNKPLVSVILPTYNSVKFLERSINSVLNQSYRKLELLIIDDCSTDNSYKIINKFLKKDKRVKLFKTKKNSGVVSVPRNLGIKKANGEYLAFLDSDDYWKVNKLEFQLSKIKNYDLSFTASDYQKDGSKKKSFFLINQFRIILQKFFTNKILINGFFWLYVYNPFLISSVIIKKKIFNNYIFNTFSNIREDLNFWLKLFQNKKIRFIYHPKILLTISRSKNSMSSNRIEEFNKIIITISNDFLENKNFDKFFYFLAGIIFRTVKIFISRVYFLLRKYFLFLFVIISLIYFFIFYSPLFWHIGQKLIYINEQKQTEAVFVLSGHRGFEYWNNSYQERYYDIKLYNEIYQNKINDTKFFLLGKLSSIPEQKLLESLLIQDNVPRENIFVIYDEYKNSVNAINLLLKNLENKNIKSITIITSPYHSFRLNKIWSSIVKENFEVVFYKHKNLPKKNNFFSRSYNKKEIIYEILANLKLKLHSHLEKY